MVDYYFTVVCKVDPGKLPPAASDEKLEAFNEELNRAVAAEKEALRLAVERAINGLS